jgi:KaiC/GvpD/RAD55 family RecA-like ATPase
LENSDKVSTGIERLDALLKGGLPQKSNILIQGPPFVGKDVVINRYVLTGLAKGEPAIFVTTDKTVEDKVAELMKMDPKYPEYEKEGLIAFVDTYSVNIGSKERRANTEYVDSPVNLNAISLAISNAQKRFMGNFEHHRIVFRSVSTLITYINAVAIFRFLQILCGRSKQAGATSMYMLESGMHSEGDMQMIQHIMDGVLEFREDDKTLKTLMRVQGSGDAFTREWIEYKFTNKEFDIVGSFMERRIK